MTGFFDGIAQTPDPDLNTTYSPASMKPFLTRSTFVCDIAIRA